MSKKIKDFVKFDDKNFNIGTELGEELINKSISKFGYREASVLDKHGNIIGGNKRTQSALDNGITDIEIIKAEKGKVYALQFDDIDLDSPEGRELALALNATAKENINFDESMIFETIGDDIAIEWGFEVEIDLQGERNKDDSNFNKSANSYLNNSIRQIVLYYDIETHTSVLESLQKIATDFDIESDNSETIQKLIEFYESKNNQG
jgi:hypothetical protein